MNQNLEGVPLRTDLEEHHFSNLIFFVGHTAIKILILIEQIDTDLRNSLRDNGGNQQQKNQAKARGSKKNEEEKAEEELDQIAGGKEAEIEQYS